MQWHELLTRLQAILAAEWTATSVVFQNEQSQATYGLPWLYFELLPVSSDTTLFGSAGRRIRSAEGLIAGHVFVPTGTAATDGFQIAEQLGALLQLRTLAPGVECGGYELAGAGSGDDEGNWFRIGVTIPVRIHTTT
jgi:hypothetical protein